MPVNKKHDEFHTLDLNAGWETPPGYPKGIEQKILSGALASLRGLRRSSGPAGSTRAR